MNIKDALELSKRTGQAMTRTSVLSGWIKYHEGWTYRLSYNELTADDWSPIGEHYHEHNDSRS